MATCVSRTRLSQASAEFHLVGESQGRAGPEHFPRRLPRAGQHRRVRSQRTAAYRRLHQPGGRHELDGDVLPQPDAHRARTGACTTRVRRHRDQVLRALSLHRGSDESTSATRRSGMWDEDDEFYYDVLHMPNGEETTAQGAVDGRADSAVRRGDARTGTAAERCRNSPRGSNGSSTTGPISRKLVSRWHEPGTENGICCRCCGATA